MSLRQPFIISHVFVTYDCVLSDHHTIMTEISINNISLESSSDRVRVKDCIKLDKMKREDTLQYNLRAEIELSKLHDHDHDFILCGDPHCNEMSLKNATCIDQMYKDLTDSLLDAGTPLASSVTHSYNQVEAWNPYCKELHTLARDAYLIWRANRKKGQGVLFDSMRRTRAQLKLAL